MDRVREFATRLDVALLHYLKGEEVDVDWKCLWRRMCRAAIFGPAFLAPYSLHELLAQYNAWLEVKNATGISQVSE
ncbi:MAG: hypothetical protein ABIH46_00320 [Chloroflexota bacterium]